MEDKGCVAAIVDAPLLFESGFDKECDVIVAVVADRQKRIERILERDNITLEMAELRLSKQQEDSFYTDKADYVIENNGALDLLDRQVESIYNSLTSNAKV